MIIRAHSVPPSASSLFSRPWFIVLVLCGAVERLSGVALGVAAERDWVVQVLPCFLSLFFEDTCMYKLLFSLSSSLK